MTSDRAGAPALYSTLTREQLLGLLRVSEDRLSRRAVDEFLRRPELLPDLAAIATDEAAWTAQGPAAWAPVHATLILAAVGGALPALFRAVSIATRLDISPVAEAADDLLGAQGPAAWDPLVRAIADPGRSDDSKAAFVSALGSLALRHPSERDRVRPILLDFARDPFTRPPIRGAATGALLRIRDPRDRALLEEWAGSGESLFDAATVAGAYATEEEPPAGASWLAFYDDESVRARHG